MEGLHISLFRQLTLFLVMLIHSTVTEPIGAEFKLLLGNKIKGEFVYFEGASVSAMACAAMCSSNASCLSAAFNHDDMNCALSTIAVNGLYYQHRLEPQTAWTTVSKKGCLDGWQEIAGTCFFVQLKTKTNSDAKVACKDEGGKLAEPRSFAAFQILGNYRANNIESYGCWIGLSYIAGQFVWNSDGTALTYDGWSDGQPNHGPEDFCVAFADGINKNKLADRPCHFLHESFCEL